MTPLRITPLEEWTGRKIGMAGSRPLSRRDLGRYQLDALNRTLSRVRFHSPFYQRRFSGLLPGPLTSLAALAAFPFTTAEDICRDPLSFLCVSRDRIARVVTLKTSGTTGGPKRLFFTKADLDLTVDFFHHGMSTLVDPGQRVLILLPGTSPASAGKLLAGALGRMSVRGIVHGPMQEPAAALRAALEKKVDCLVGVPVQVLAMACHEEGRRLAGQIQSVLLSTDYVPDAIVSRLTRIWGCRVFKHYGMTEMGMGGGVECLAQRGYHVREADLLVEIIDPENGQPLPDGCAGEIVFTTLSREGMPLVRYRTGDMAAFRGDACPCGTVLKTVGPIWGRLDGCIQTGRRAPLFMGDLDEAVFGIGGIVNFHADIDTARGADRLTLWIATRKSARFKEMEDRVRRAVLSLPAIRTATARGRLAVRVKPADLRRKAFTGIGKRRFHNLRERIMHP